MGDADFTVLSVILHISRGRQMQLNDAVYLLSVGDQLTISSQHPILHCLPDLLHYKPRTLAFVLL